MYSLTALPRSRFERSKSWLVISMPVGVRHRTVSLSIPTGAPGNGTTQEFGPRLGGGSCKGLVRESCSYHKLSGVAVISSNLQTQSHHSYGSWFAPAILDKAWKAKLQIASLPQDKTNVIVKEGASPPCTWLYSNWVKLKFSWDHLILPSAGEMLEV